MNKKQFGVLLTILLLVSCNSKKTEKPADRFPGFVQIGSDNEATSLYLDIKSIKKEDSGTLLFKMLRIINTGYAIQDAKTNCRDAFLGLAGVKFTNDGVSDNEYPGDTDVIVFSENKPIFAIVKRVCKEAGVSLIEVQEATNEVEESQTPVFADKIESPNETAAPNEQPLPVAESTSATKEQTSAEKDALIELPCDTLWKKRNQIFHDKGYCFTKDTGKNIFDNEGCKYEKASEIPLSESEKEHVRMLREIEENKGCVKRTEVTLGDSAAKNENQPTTTSSTLIRYDSPATPLVIQMLESARDTEKLFAAKSGLDGLGKPTKGDRKAARKLNDSAIALIKESKDQEALPILEEAHKTDPSDIEITNNLASTYSRIPATENFDPNDKTKAMLVETMLLKSDRAIAWANLGRAFANESNEKAATNCYINFFRFAENKDKALSRLQSGINETHPVLGKAMLNAYSYVKASVEATNNSE